MSLTLTPLQIFLSSAKATTWRILLLSASEQNNIEIEDNDILVFAQKIVSKAEGRAVNLVTVTPSQRAIELAGQTEKDARVVELNFQESNEVLRTRVGTIIVEHKLGFVCANAGIDHSNVAGAGDSARGMGLAAPCRTQTARQKRFAGRFNPKQGKRSAS